MAERLADVETMIEFVKRYTPCINGETTMECVERSIRNAPTVEAKPVVHAHWVDVNPNLHIGMKCSLCGARIKYSEFFNGNHRYCHKCGAQMDEGVKIPVISMEDVPKIMEEMEK